MAVKKSTTNTSANQNAELNTNDALDNSVQGGGLLPNSEQTVSASLNESAASSSNGEQSYQGLPSRDFFTPCPGYYSPGPGQKIKPIVPAEENNGGQE